ncbi:MAG TPA: hypothetical protein PK156_26900 [Polyangium sp.]|nr:hypothetical protein [Polyangium sp.]
MISSFLVWSNAVCLVTTCNLADAHAARLFILHAGIRRIKSPATYIDLVFEVVEGADAWK